MPLGGQLLLTGAHEAQRFFANFLHEVGRNFEVACGGVHVGGESGYDF